MKRIVDDMKVCYVNENARTMPKDQAGFWAMLVTCEAIGDAMCRVAVEKGAVDLARYIALGESCCVNFYVACDDTDGHKRILKFLLDHQFISMTFLGELENIEYTLENSDSDLVHGRRVRLGDFVDLTTGVMFPEPFKNPLHKRSEEERVDYYRRRLEDLFCRTVIFLKDPAVPASIKPYCVTDYIDRCIGVFSPRDINYIKNILTAVYKNGSEFSPYQSVFEVIRSHRQILKAHAALLIAQKYELDATMILSKLGKDPDATPDLTEEDLEDLVSSASWERVEEYYHCSFNDAKPFIRKAIVDAWSEIKEF